MISPLKRNIIRCISELNIHSPYGVFHVYNGQELTIKSVISFSVELKDSKNNVIPFGIIVDEFPPSIILHPEILENFVNATEIDFDQINNWFNHQKEHLNNRIKQYDKA